MCKDWFNLYLAIITGSQTKATILYHGKTSYVRYIADYIEFKVAVPSSLILHKMLCSDYKSHTTVKILLGISPGGWFFVVSSTFPGSISNKSITAKMGLLNPNLWEQGNELIVHRGFTV